MSYECVWEYANVLEGSVAVGLWPTSQDPPRPESLGLLWGSKPSDLNERHVSKARMRVSRSENEMETRKVQWK